MRAADADWRAYLASLEVFGMRPGLERVAALLECVGRPHRAYRVIHIVGTNGKSSTTRYCEALLAAHGLRSGAYLSPHLSGWEERVLVGGRPVSAELFGRSVQAVREAVAELPAELGETTQFEVLTVAGLLALAESGVEVVALEAGLGGRLDATNCVRASVVVLTNVALEHTEVLGETRELIFAEKAAVIKGGHAVFGDLSGLEGRARAACEAAGARPYLLGEEFSVAGGPDAFSVTFGAEVWAGLSVPTPALYQVQNAALAALAVRLLLGRLKAGSARSALAETAVPGRLQRLGERPLVLADGAHNPDGVAALARSLAAVSLPQPVVGVLAMMRDKAYDNMLERLLPSLDEVVCTQASAQRSLSAEELAAALRAAAARRGVGLPTISVIPEPSAAVALAVRRAGADGAVLIAGSLYLLEDLKELLEAPTDALGYTCGKRKEGCR